MKKQDLIAKLQAIAQVLDGVQLRTDQVSYAAKINSCSNLLCKIVKELEESEKEEPKDEADHK